MVLSAQAPPGDNKLVREIRIKIFNLLMRNLRISALRRDLRKAVGTKHFSPERTECT